MTSDPRRLAHQPLQPAARAGPVRQHAALKPMTTQRFAGVGVLGGDGLALTADGWTLPGDGARQALLPGERR
ncbi:MAG: hypothetical protein ACTHMG_03435 [Sphingomonas sp.]